jgi:DGQHR domain-containing protein
MRRSITIPATKIIQNGNVIYQTTISAGLLAEYTVTDMLSEINPDGYQRPLHVKHVNDFERFLAGELGKTPVCANALVFNDRNKSILERYKDTTNGVDHVEITITDPLYIIDGQHRAAAYAQSVKHKTIEGSFSVPVTITQLDKRSEKELFITINGTQFTVKSNLNLEVMSNLELEENIPLHNSNKARRKIIGTRITGILDKHEMSPLNSLIERVNVTHTEKSRPITRTSLITTMEKILGAIQIHSIFDNENFHSVNTTAKVMMDFWDVIRELNPKPFEYPQDYHMLKALGINTLNPLLADVIKYCNRNHKELTRATFKNIIGKSEYLTNPTYWSMGGEFGKHGGTRGFTTVYNDFIYPSIFKTK